MKKIIKKELKYLTIPIFEKGMDFMAKSFNKVFERFDKNDEKFFKISEKLDCHDKVFDIMLKEMQGFNKEAREHRMTMSGLNHSDISQEREIKGLKIRIKRLEEKIK